MIMYLCGNNLEDWLRAGFSKILAQQSLEIAEKLEEADALVVINWHPKFGKFLTQARRDKKLTFLIVSEPGVVIAEHGLDHFKTKFSEVIEIGRPQGPLSVPYFQECNLDYFDRSLEERQPKTVAVSSNKSAFLKGELYSLRRRIYSVPQVIDVYGKDWDKGYLWTGTMALKQLLVALRTPNLLSLGSLADLFVRPKNYLGQVEDKFEVMSHYRQALVIENSVEYMSEKLMDAICAGCIPIYVGAGLQDFGVPTNLVIHCSAAIDSVRAGMCEAMSIDYESWKVQARDWLLNSDVLKKREPAEVMALVASRISLRSGPKLVN